MTTVMFRPCVKFLFENYSYYENNYFLEGEGGKKWKYLGWRHFFCSKKSGFIPVWSKSVEVNLTFILLWLWKMSYIFYVNHMSEFGVWIKMWRAEVFSRMLVFLWSFLLFLLATIEYVCLFSKKKKMFSSSLSQFWKLH